MLIWGIFWLIERLYGVAVNISGWSLFLPGFRVMTLKTANLELVSYCRMVNVGLIPFWYVI